jgi:hypothetical protein
VIAQATGIEIPATILRGAIAVPAVVRDSDAGVVSAANDSIHVAGV